MVRQLRVEWAGAIYRVMNRGDRRERSCLDDADRVAEISRAWALAARGGFGPGFGGSSTPHHWAGLASRIHGSALMLPGNSGTRLSVVSSFISWMAIGLRRVRGSGFSPAQN
jgi:hypothetical protein